MAGHRGDIAIIGGGILGVVVANEALDAGYRPVVFRLTDRAVPFADSFRNQAWLQTGLRYIRHSPDLAALMWTYGRRLHEALGLPIPSGRGVFVLPTAGDEKIFLDDAKRLGVSEAVKALAPEEALRVLGAHFKRGSYVYSSPESPFDEGALVRHARSQAERRHAVFCELSEPVEIIPQAGRSPSHRLRVDGKEMEFATTILAAGAGNIPLLESLRDQVAIEITQTPLLVIPGVPTIQTEILIDRVEKVSLVAHAPGPSRSDGCTVLAADVHEPVESYCLPSKREVSPHKKKALLDAVPEPLRARIPQSRMTAGWELAVVRNGQAAHTAEPFIETAQGYDDIVIAMPGRATLALYAAERVMARITKRRTKKGATSSERQLPTAPWDVSDIRMHHEEYFDERLND